jgi:phosphoglycolate phosphatase
VTGLARKVDGLLFDKDGTLFDFHSTWSVWARDVIATLSGGDGAVMARMAEAMHYDLEVQRFRPTSPIIAGTNREAAECVRVALPDRPLEEIEHFLMMSSASAPLQPPVPLDPYLTGLAGQGLKLGVMTNDSEYAARAQLDSAGVGAHFAFVAGFDSGYGAKPEPGPLLAFARAVGLSPDRVAMVGDSTHDLLAGRAAGMQTIAVLTGTALEHELAPHADAVFPDIGHIPGWLSA